MNEMIRVSICDGKYTIVQDSSGRTNVLRYGGEWRDVTGDNVILGATYEIERLREQVKRLESILRQTELAIAFANRERNVIRMLGDDYTEVLQLIRAALKEIPHA